MVILFLYAQVGWSNAELFPKVLDVGFDGIIGAAGGFIEMEEEVLFHERVKKEDVQHLVDFFNKHGIDFKLESNAGIFASGNYKKRLQSIIKNLLIENPESKEGIEKGLLPMLDIIIEGNGKFPQEVVEDIKFIKRTQDLGFTLEEIKNLLAASNDENFRSVEIRDFATGKIKEIETKSHDLLSNENIT